MTTQYDYIVIGGGSAGVRSARIASALGARTLVVEESRLGGTCVNVGCVPKKLYAIASHFSTRMREAESFGWTDVGARHDWTFMRERVAREIRRLNAAYTRTLENASVEIVRGRASFLSPGTLCVGDRQFSAEHILIATGARARPVDFKGSEYARDSDAFFSLDERPDRAVILGAGYIGVEFASILRNFGCEVHVVNRSQGILSGFDRECASALEKSMKGRGVHFHFEAQIQEIVKDAGRYHAVLGNQQSIAADVVFATLGRVPNTEGLDLAKAGVRVGERGEIVVSAEGKTNVEGIYALGDVIGGPQLTPVALNQGMTLARRLFGGGQVWPEPDFQNVATAVFSDPQLGALGMTEDECLDSGIEVDVFQSSFRPMDTVLNPEGERCLLKMLVNVETNEVMGLHMVGNGAGEMLQGMAAALSAGARKKDLDRVIGIHPTVAEEWVTMRTPSRRLNSTT